MWDRICYVTSCAVVIAGCSTRGAADEQDAIFVDGDSGQDNRPGTADAPVRTLARGVELAQAQGKRLRVCAAANPYVEFVEVSSSAIEGLEGGLRCGDWTATDRLAEIAAPDSSRPALRILSSLPFAVHDVALRAPDGTEANPSSVALRIEGSGVVELMGVRIDSGLGWAPSSSKPPASQLALPAAVTTRIARWDDVTCTCPGGNLGTGGIGLGDAIGGPPRAGTPEWQPTDGHDGSPGNAAHCDGAQGADGGNGSDGRGAALPVLDDMQSAVASADGQDGLIGQGGGGGMATAAWGACGGCGGIGGARGLSGGSSVGVAVIDATLRLVDSVVIANAAGDGQPGGDFGGIPAEGRSGEIAESPAGSSCKGGDGGHGGRGGRGGGGAGGVSAAIAFRGATLDIAASSALQFGRAGAAGEAPNPGAAGLAGEIVELPASR